MNKVLAVVVTYNRINTLKQCIHHILNQTYACDVLIVNNNSTDDTEVWGKSVSGTPLPDSTSVSRKIIYENTGSNIGGAGGFNFGMKKSIELGYDYVWIMDDDAFPDSDCLEKLMTAGAKMKEFGFLSSMVLWTDGNLCKMNWQRKFSLPKNRDEHHITDDDYRNSLNSDNKLLRIQSATFVSLLFPASVIRKVGLPIKEFFIWCDDIEYTRRISLKNGLPCFAVFDSTIVHHTATNVGTDLASDDEARIPRYNYAFRNENYMYRQYGLKGFGYYILVCAYNACKVIKNAKTLKGKRLGIIFKNFFTGLFFNPEVEMPDSID